ncbi:NnrS family protein [Tardiphaga sp. 804_B3_N1_9]|uniref:NnrS family protein n=1 Tax=Tardiphaga TaxID=1395974 RepID=UPI0015864611|nr:NnrS family protein [Tardiphaga robiniae]NUU42833.1 short-chain dehydrogenase [Tardiphaga robiniae]
MTLLRVRSIADWPLLSAGFRPFFLLGACYAGLAILIWMPAFHGRLALASGFAPRDWHIHEMLFGFMSAVVTGFLFTAIPNWTGRLPIRGLPLLGLVVLWIAGRICLTFSAYTGWLVAMLVDVSFLTLVAAAATREIAAGRNWRNLPVVGIVAFLLVGNIAFHVEAHLAGAADVSIRIGVAVVVLLISLIGGRIVPSFTRNWLVRENPGRLPVPFARFDMIVIAISAAALLLWIARPFGALTGVALALVGLLHIMRLARWAGDRTSREGLLLILHIGYAFVPLGFLLNAAAAAGWVAPSAGLHAWMAGAAGVMTLAVMSRATLGHTGQALHASRTTLMIYAAVIVAALARIGAVIAPAYSPPLLHVAALTWVAAFIGFAVSFGPLLIGYRKPRRSDAAMALSR